VNVLDFNNNLHTFEIMKCLKLTEQDFEKASSVFGALASPKRLTIVKLLGEKPMSVTELGKELDCRLSCVSQHLTVLKSCNIVTAKRNGHEVFYTLSMQCVSSFLDCLMRNSCDKA